MNIGADRIEVRVKQRIKQNRYDRAGATGQHFAPLELTGHSTSIGRDYRRDRWSLGELLSYYDRQFVQNAYLVLLKRDADVEGLTDRLRRLQAGEVSRIELLFRLRYGPEGKEYKTRVRGLLWAFILERLCRFPVLGVIPGYIWALLCLPRMQRDIEEIRALIAMQKNDSDDKDRAIVDFQNEKFDKIIRRLWN